MNQLLNSLKEPLFNIYHGCISSHTQMYDELLNHATVQNIIEAYKNKEVTSDDIKIFTSSLLSEYNKNYWFTYDIALAGLIIILSQTNDKTTLLHVKDAYNSFDLKDNNFYWTRKIEKLAKINRAAEDLYDKLGGAQVAAGRFHVGIAPGPGPYHDEIGKIFVYLTTKKDPPAVPEKFDGIPVEVVYVGKVKPTEV